jgi:hypothetical protein
LRADPKLVAVVEKLGTARASGPIQRIVVVDVPDDAEWAIYRKDDGKEFVYDKRRVWGLDHE